MNPLPDNLPLATVPDASQTSRGAGVLRVEKEYLLFVLVNALDFLMTYTLLFTGHFQESNPLPRFFLNHWGVKGLLLYKLLIVLAVCLLVQMIAWQRPTLARNILRFGSWLAVCVVFYSLFLSLHAPVV